MINYNQITIDYPQAVVVGISEYFLPKRKWQSLAQPLDALMQFTAFEQQLVSILDQGATKVGFTIQDKIQKTHYTVYVKADELRDRPAARKPRPAAARRTDTSSLASDGNPA